MGSAIGCKAGSLMGVGAAIASGSRRVTIVIICMVKLMGCGLSFGGCFGWRSSVEVMLNAFIYALWLLVSRLAHCQQQILEYRANTYCLPGGEATHKGLRAFCASLLPT